MTVVVDVQVVLAETQVCWKCRQGWNYHWLLLQFQTTDAPVVTWMMMLVVSVSYKSGTKVF